MKEECKLTNAKISKDKESQMNRAIYEDIKNRKAFTHTNNTEGFGAKIEMNIEENK